MKKYQGIISDFMKVMSSLNLISLKTKENILIQTISQELIVLFFNCIDFLKEDTEENHTNLMGDVDELVKFLYTATSLKRIDEESGLGAERDLLAFKIGLMRYRSQRSHNLELNIDASKSKNSTHQSKVETSDLFVNHDRGLRSLQQKIIDFVASEDRVLNVDVFEKFKHLNIRSIKRHLSDLISRGYIQRSSSGKKVYYNMNRSKAIDDDSKW